MLQPAYLYCLVFQVMTLFYETWPHFPTLSRIGYMFKLDIVESSALGAIDAHQSPAVLFQRGGKQFLNGHTSYKRMPFYPAPLIVSSPVGNVC